MENFDGPYTYKYVVREIPKLNKIRSHQNYMMIEENIHVVKKFITEEELLFLNSIVLNSDENEWYGDGEGHGRAWWYKRMLPFTNDQQNDINILNLMNRVQSLLDEPTLELASNGRIGAIHRLKPGEDMFEHCDNPIYEEYDLNENHYKFVNLGLQYAITMYINDFDGGEVYYPNLGIQYKPEKGDILWHPGTKKYTHGVKPVTGDSIRYIMTTFVNDSNIAKQNHKIVGWNK